MYGSDAVAPQKGGSELGVPQQAENEGEHGSGMEVLVNMMRSVFPSVLGEGEVSSSPEQAVSMFQVIADAEVTMLGIVPAALPPEPVILRHVEAGSWADLNGISVGDELLEVNGRKVVDCTLIELDVFLRRERPLRMTFLCTEAKDIAAMTTQEFKELRRASTGEVMDFVERMEVASSVAGRQDPPVIQQEEPNPVAMPLRSAGSTSSSAGAFLGWQTSANVVQLGSTLVKSSGGYKGYDASAVSSLLVRDIAVRAGQTSTGKRLGLTADAADGPEFDKGCFLGLYPGRKLYIPGGTDSVYSTDDVITMQVEDHDVVAYKGHEKLHTWFGVGQEHGLFAKVFFFEPDASVLVVSAEDALAEDNDVQTAAVHGTLISELVGEWVYCDSYEYAITRTQSGRLQFEEARTDPRHPSAVRRVSGILRPSGPWLEAEISDGDARSLGQIRLRYLKDEKKVVSAVKLATDQAWGVETVARRKTMVGVVELNPLMAGMSLSSADVEPSNNKVDTVDVRPMPFDTVAEVGAASLQIVNGKPIPPQYWGITGAQCRALLRRLREDKAWNRNNTVYDLVAHFVRPWTQGTGISYALQQNSAQPREVDLAVSHAWGENAEDFLEAVLRSVGDKEVLFITALCLYQAEDGAGPTVQEQLGRDPAESPFQRVLEHIQARGRAAGCLWAWGPYLQMIPMLLVILACLLFYSPVVAWGCVPNYDGLRCAVRRPTEARGASDEMEWVWLEQYETWVQEQTALIKKVVFFYWPNPAAAGLLLVAILVQVLFWARRAFGGRLLIVPGRQCTLNGRLWCVHETFGASALGLPVVLANTLASTGRCDSLTAECSDPRDKDRLRKEIEAREPDGKGYSSVDRVLRAVQRRGVRATLLALLRWALLVAVLRVADRRLGAAVETSWDGAGTGSLGVAYFGLIGVVAGLILDVCIMYFLAWKAAGSPRCLAVWAGSLLLFLASAAIIAVHIYLGDLKREFSQDWVNLADTLHDDCFGYLQRGQDCSRLLTFWGGLAESLAAGGGFLMTFLFGAICFPACCRGCLRVSLSIVVISTAALATSVYASPEIPELDFVYCACVFYLTRLLARAVGPLLALWAGVSRWGIRIGGRRRQTLTPHSRAVPVSDTDDFSNPTADFIGISMAPEGPFQSNDRLVVAH